MLHRIRHYVPRAWSKLQQIDDDAHTNRGRTSKALVGMSFRMFQNIIKMAHRLL